MPERTIHKPYAQSALTVCVSLALVLIAATRAENHDVPVGPPSLKVVLPPLVSAKDIEWYSRILSLAPPQVSLVDQMFARYQEQAEAYLKQEASTLSTLAAAAGSARTPIVTFEGAALSTQLSHHEERVAARLNMFDDSFIAEVASICGESQIVAIERVRWHRLRARCARSSLFIPGARIDLTAIVQQLVAADPATDIGMAQDALLQYEVAVTPLFAAIERAYRGERESVHMLEARISTTSASNTADTQAKVLALMAEYPGIYQNKTRLQRQLAELNRQHVPSIASALPQGLDAAFEEAAMAGLYPAVYPDHAGPRQVCAELLHSRIWTPEQRLQVEQIIRDQMIHYERICGEMCSRANDWHARHALTNSRLGYEEYSAEMRKLRTDRWSLTLDLIQQVEAILSENPDATMQQTLAAARESVDSTIARAQNDRYYPPFR